MSKLLFRLRHVPEDEADEVRELLAAHDIAVYETSAGNWGISMPALWIEDEARFEEARALLEAYQRERAHRIREEFEALRKQGQAGSMFSAFKDNPLRFLSYSVLIGVVIYLSISTFFSFNTL
jgi:hypothetical protein